MINKKPLTLKNCKYSKELHKLGVPYTLYTDNDQTTELYKFMKKK